MAKTFRDRLDDQAARFDGLNGASIKYRRDEAVLGTLTGQRLATDSQEMAAYGLTLVREELRDYALNKADLITANAWPPKEGDEILDEEDGVLCRVVPNMMVSKAPVYEFVTTSRKRVIIHSITVSDDA